MAWPTYLLAFLASAHAVSACNALPNSVALAQARTQGLVFGGESPLPASRTHKPTRGPGPTTAHTAEPTATPTCVAPDGSVSNSPGCRVDVDLGYARYQGYYDDSYDQNVFKGVRYAAPPTGAQRWQPPRAPATNRTLQSTLAFASRCPQSANSVVDYAPCGDISMDSTLPASCAQSEGFKDYVLGNEDCLFLSVYAPRKAKDLPVMIWVHGGGYGQGDGTQNLSDIIYANDNRFVGIAIQYRLGAFGFLASDEVKRFGTVNAGLLDQRFAFEWAQKYIKLFGGDPSRVTIIGESAGAGSVMLHDMAYGGQDKETLFTQTIAASPYLPMQWKYDDYVPSQNYYAFASALGCEAPTSNSSGAVLACLRSKDTLLLQQASYSVSTSVEFGEWAFLPVTDGTFIQDLPSVQLNAGRVNGKRALVGNNALEGGPFTPGNISSAADFQRYTSTLLPLFSRSDLAQLYKVYPPLRTAVDPNAQLFATPGRRSSATAQYQSSLTTGNQQLAVNVYGETTFVCPSYWQANAYAMSGRSAYKYQFSIPPALHGNDVSVYFGPLPENVSPDFAYAMRRAFGNFIIMGDPSIDALTANGVSTGNSAPNPLSRWPLWAPGPGATQVNLNVSGGVPEGLEYNSNGFVAGLTVCTDPGLANDFAVVNAWDWEGGRGQRCEFWRKMGSKVPER